MASVMEEEALDVQEHMSKGALAALMATETSGAEAAALQADAASFFELADEEAAEFGHALEELQAFPHLTAEEAKVVEEIGESWPIFLAELEEVEADVAEGEAFLAGEAALHGEGEEAFAAVIGEINELRADFEAEAAVTKADADSTYQSARTLVLGFIIVAFIIGVAIASFLAWSISKGVGKISTALSRIAVGELDEQVEITSNDEIGDMARSYSEMQSYLMGMATAADQIAEGDLSAEVQPKSEKDVLGTAFTKMLGNLHALLTQVTDTVAGVGTAKDQLAQAADQTAQASQQVASSTSQVAEGTNQQATSAQEVNGSMEQLTKVVEQVASGGQTQSQAIEETAALGQRVADGADQMSESAQQAAGGASQATETAQNGAEMVQKTIEGIGRIRSAVASRRWSR